MSNIVFLLRGRGRALRSAMPGPGARLLAMLKNAFHEPKAFCPRTAVLLFAPSEQPGGLCRASKQ
jgi:hypothetical protein